MNGEHSIACGVFTNDDGRCTCKEIVPVPDEELERWERETGEHRDSYPLAPGEYTETA